MRFRSRPAGGQAVLFALFALAVITRVGHLLELRSDPFLDRPIMDAEYHELWARSILAGEPYFVSPVFFRAPLYPYLLAAIRGLLGFGPWAPRVVQMLMGLASLGLLYHIARLLAGRRVAILALALGSLYDLLPFYEGELLLPATLILLDLAAFERTLAFVRGRRARDAILAGTLFGLSAVTRPNILAVVPFLAAWCWRETRSPARAWLFLIATLPFPLFVTALNWHRGGDPVFIASQGGVNFYLGNNPASNGWSAVVPGMRTDWWGSYEDGIHIPEREVGRQLKPSEVSTFWTRRALAEMAADPGWAIRHTLRKAYLWFGAEELSNNRDLRYWKTRFPVIDLLPVRYAILVPLALVGFFLAPRRASQSIALFVLPYAASFVVFFITSRYRLVTVPFLCILAASALMGLADSAAHRAWKRFGALFGVVLGLTAFFSANLGGVAQPNFAISYLEIGKRETERQAWGAARAAFQTALEHDPENLDARHDLGVALREGGDAEAGLRELSAVAEARGAAGDWNNVGITLALLGRVDEARQAYDRAIERDSTLADAWLNSALLAAGKGDLSDALRRLDRGGQLRGSDPAIWYHRGILLEGLGRLDEAREAFGRCLAAAPSFADAAARLRALEDRERAARERVGARQESTAPSGRTQEENVRK